MKRIVTAALLAASVGFLAAPGEIQAQTVEPGMRMAQALENLRTDRAYAAAAASSGRLKLV